MQLYGLKSVSETSSLEIRRSGKRMHYKVREASVALDSSKDSDLVAKE